MDGDTASWHENYDNETVSQGVSNASITNGIESSELMIKRADLKYCYFGKDYEEVLFDLSRDPGETVNRIDDADYAEAVETFRERRGELGYGPEGDPDYETAGYDTGL